MDNLGITIGTKKSLVNNFEIEPRLQANMSEYNLIIFICKQTVEVSIHIFFSDINDKEAVIDGINFSAGTKGRLIATLKDDDKF